MHARRRTLFVTLLSAFLVASAVAADPTSDTREVKVAELGLTLIPPPELIRNSAREAEVRRIVGAKAPTSAIFELDPELLKRDPKLPPRHFIVNGTRVDTKGMTPERQLRISLLGADYFDTQTSDLKIAGIPAKRFQYQQSPLVGKPNPAVFDGGVKYYFCRPGLLLSVDFRIVVPKDQAEALLKQCDAAVATMKFEEP